MTIDWKDPKKELPKNGDYVACLQYHWKECWPLSAEIIFGEIEVGQGDPVPIRVNTCDFTGSGSSYLYFPPKDGRYDSDLVAAWAYAREFKRPDFLNHNKHWGSEK